MAQGFKNLPGTGGSKREPPRETFGRRERSTPESRPSLSAGRFAVLACVIAIGLYVVAQLADIV